MLIMERHQNNPAVWLRGGVEALGFFRALGFKWFRVGWTLNPKTLYKASSGFGLIGLRVRLSSLSAMFWTRLGIPHSSS